MRTKTFFVAKAHMGDKWYDEGDERDAVSNKVRHLVKNGTLMTKAGWTKEKKRRAAILEASAEARAKAEAIAANKAEQANKTKAG